MSEPGLTCNEIDTHLANHKSRQCVWIIIGAIPILVHNRAQAAGGDDLIHPTIADTAQSNFQDGIAEARAR